MSEFNLASVLRDVNAQDLGHAGREQIVYIDIDLIDPDPATFYELSDLDELAANIELVGLQQPLRVRVHPEQPDRWMIVSGHRRRAAIRQLVDDGKDELRAVACIVEQPAASKELQELRLIYANSGTRKMTPAEISKQAERVEILLYQLKEQGVEFPGRMRDHVAEACKVSKSKLARLKVIRDHLIPECMVLFEMNDLSEATAYAFAKLDPEMQKRVYLMYNSSGKMRGLSEFRVPDAAKFIKAIRERKCPVNKGSCCTHQWSMELRFVDKPYQYHYCEHTDCCRSCSQFIECKDVCPMLCNEVRKLRKEKRDKRSEELREEKARSAAKIENVKEIWKRFGEIRSSTEKSVRDVFDAMGKYWTAYGEEDAIKKEQGEGKFTETSYLPFGYLKLSEMEPVFAAADLFGCSLDYLLGRTDTPTPAAAPVWRNPEKGELPAEGETVVALVQYSPGAKWSLEYLTRKREGWEQYGMPVPADIRIRWQPYHDPDEDVPDSGTEGDEQH